MKIISTLFVMLLVSITAVYAKLQPVDFTVYGKGAVGSSIAVANSGNVYVASRTSGENGNGIVSPVAYDGYALTKMNADGQIIWTKYITNNNVPIVTGSEIKCVVDNQENVIVAMNVYTTSSGNKNDLININDNEQVALSSGSRGCGLLVSYNSDGVTNFSKSYKNISDGDKYDSPMISDIAVDNNGNIYVVGSQYRSFYADAHLVEVHKNPNNIAVQTGFVLKYSNEGELQSSNRFLAGRGISNLILTCDNENIYCAGQYDFSFFDGANWHKHPNAPVDINHSTTNQGIFVQKLNLNLVPTQTRFLEVIREGNSYIEQPCGDIFIAKNKNIILTGAKGDFPLSYNGTEVFPLESGSKKSYIVAFNSNFEFQWSHLIGKENNSQFYVTGKAIGEDKDGNIYLATNARTNVNIGDTILGSGIGGHYAGVIAKFSGNGNFIHASLLNFGEYNDIKAIAFNADKSKMYLTGNSLYWQYQNKFENISPKRYDGDIENTATSMFVCRYEDIELIDPNVLTLKSQFPSLNETNITKTSPVRLSFNKNVIARSDMSISLYTPSTGYQENISSNYVSITDTVATFSIANLQDGKKHVISIPVGFFIDSSNPENSWPRTEEYTIGFSVAKVNSQLTIDFLSDPKENLTWTSQDSIVGTYYTLYNGYYDFNIKGIPMRWKTIITRDIETGFDSVSVTGPVNLIADASLTVKTSGITNNITHIRSQLYQNCVEMQIKMFSGRKEILQNSIDGCIPEEDWLYREDAISDGWGGEYFPQYINHNMSNESSSKIDSLKYINSEGYVLQIELEIIDNATPQVNLGDDRKICRGDSVLLDAGLMLGAEYNWSNNATTQKIWVKEAGDYSVTVKNTLGEATDVVNVQVLDPIVTILPDTIYACPGDTVTLVAGDDNYGYFWSVRYPQDTPIRKVTESGLYSVIISNGACLVIDSVRVIYRKGARLNASFLQGGMTGYEDVEGQLYKENSAGRFELYKTKNMPQIVFFDSLPAGNYVLKAQFVQYTHANSSSFYSTYHDGNILWHDVQAFKLTCESDTTINFLLASRESNFEFNGTGIITGKVAIQNNSDTNISLRMKARSTSSCDTQVMLLDGNGNIIATQCPDANGNYSFENLPHGNYSIAIERTGFEQPILFNATIDAQNPTVSNANFVIDESTQSISQGVISSIQNNDISYSTQLKMWPNPSNDGNTSIEFDAPSRGQYNIRIINLNGQIIHNFEHELAQGTNKIELPRIQQSGMYIVRVSASLFSANAKLVVE